MSAQAAVDLAVVERVPLPSGTPPATLGAAAQRFARLSLRKSEQTKATYESTYRRFAAWLAEHAHGPAAIAGARAAGRAAPEAPLEAFTVDALAAYLDELEAIKAPATVKKERAALNRLAKYLHTLGVIDATEILLIEGSRGGAQERKRDALDAATWQRVEAIARSRINQGPRGRTSRAAASRDLALILLMGDMGLRSEEARTLLVSSITPKRSDGVTPWLRVHGKGDKQRDLPIPHEVADALLQWREYRDQIVADTTSLLFLRLGRQRHDGSFPDAGPSYDHNRIRLDQGQLSGRALRDIVAPIMRAAGVPAQLAHPHVLRHTYGTHFMRKPNAKLEQLRVLMGHASIETTARYVHHTEADLEAAVLNHHAALDVLAAQADRRRVRNARRAG